MPAPARYAAKAMELNQGERQVHLEAESVRGSAVCPRICTTHCVRLNAVHYIPEKLAAPVDRQRNRCWATKVDRKQTAKELAVYVAFMGLSKALGMGLGKLKGVLFPDGITPAPIPPAGDAPDVKPTSLPNAESAVGGGAAEVSGAKPTVNEELPTKLPADTFKYKQNPSSVVLSPKVKPGTYVYVQDPQGVVHVVPDYTHMHPTVLGGYKPAAGAGTLTINKDGIVVELDNISGTFEFGQETLPRVKASTNTIEKQSLKWRQMH